MGKENLFKVFERAKKNNKKVMIPYITAGFPDKTVFWSIVEKLSLNGADIIEIGVPFSDPIADGPVIEGVSYRCLQQKVSLKWILEGLSYYRSKIKSEILLMGYCNPFERFGWERLCEEAFNLGISGFIVPDLPIEESGYVENYMKKKDLALIRLIGVNTSRDRMKKYSKRTDGFVYFVSVLGTTGPRDGFSDGLVVKIKEAREIFSIPIVVGFGAKHPSQFYGLLEYIDGIVFGSSLILHIENGKKVEEFIRLWQF